MRTGQPRSRTEAPRGRVARVIALSLGAGALSTLSALISLRLTRSDLTVPWGRGDAVLHYLLSSTMGRFGSFLTNPDIGYPWGMDGTHFPMPEVRLWGQLWVITRFVDDPIVALNLLFLVGFFFVGAASYLLFAPTVRAGWLAMLLAVSAATLPWHFSRFRHILLADYSPVPLFLLLAFLMWRGWWRGSPARLGAALAASVYVGTGGLYYSFFAVLVLGPVLIWRIWTARTWREWWPDAAVVLTIPAVLFGLVATIQSRQTSPSVGPSAFERYPGMSLVHAGDPTTFLKPWPFSEGSLLEEFAYVDPLTSIAVVTALGLLVYLAVTGIRGGRSRVIRRLDRELAPWFRLLLWVFLWFAPGLGWVFATAVSPVIRAWGRLSVVIAYIVLVILGIAVRTLLRRRPGLLPVVVVALSATVAWQVARDHRAFLPTWAQQFDAEATSYASQLRGHLEPGCPVLQLPIRTYPEDWRLALPSFGAYDHMWMPVYAPGYRWSFGVVRGTPGGLASAERYPEGLPVPALVERARADGYCAIHVDSVGLATTGELEEPLGEPTLEVGRWSLYPLVGRSG